MTLSTLKAALKRGRTPEDLGFKRLGFGAIRTAWTKAGWVVKLQNQFGDIQADKSCPGSAWSVRVDCGVRPAPTHIVGEWEIQRRYRPLGRPTSQERDLLLRCLSVSSNDTHQCNIGRTRTGRLVAFDW